MKRIKYLTLTLFAILALGFTNAQINVDFSSTLALDSCSQQEWQFYDSTTNVPPGATLLWSFGDGTTSTLANPNHFYNITTQQTFSTTLTYYLNGNVIGSHSEPLTLSSSFNQVEFNYAAPINCGFPQTYDFIGFELNPNSPIVNWQWFIDGQLIQTSGNVFSQTFTSAGTHQVVVEGYTQNGCYSSWMDIVNVGAGGNGLTVAASYQTITEDCIGAVVDLYSSVSGGVAPYTFQWSWYDIGSSTLANPQQVQIMTSVDPNVYLTVTDANGCTGTATVVVQNGSFITANTNSQPTSACGAGCDGSIDVVATGTAGPYTFEANNQVQTGNQAVFNNLCAGIYDVIITDQNGCSEVIVEQVMQDSLSSIIVDAIINPGSSACNTATVCDASVDIVVTGGVAPFLYSFDQGTTYQGSNQIFGLCAGTYDVLVEDANGCAVFYNFTINTGATLSAQSYEYYDNCDSTGNPSGNGSLISVNAFGGTAPYTYAWSDGSTTNNIQNPTPGVYTVIITDANGCTYSETFNVPSNNCYTISGNVYVDVNGNCVFDSTDYAVSCFVDLTATAGGPWLWIYDYTDANGYYEISAAAGTYFFDVNGTQVNNLTPLCPNTNYSVTLDSANNNVTVDFFLTPPPPTQDLSINMWTPYTFTPGFPTFTTVQYCNDGTIPMSGNVVVQYDPSLVWYQSGTTPSGHVINNNDVPSTHDAVNQILTYDFVGLLPGQCVYLDVDYETPIGTGLLPGDPIYIDAVVNPIAGDVTPTNNTTYLPSLITSSWDPNDKAVSPDGDITVDDNDHAYYIRFQNEGNGNANTVVVKDELDANLDLHSLRNVYASHDYILTVENNNTLVFTFNNIQLPPKSVNELASQGFVAFTLTQDGDLPVGTIINNTADIYFDFNPAIVTNTVENEIVEKVTGITTADVQNALSVFPNPSTGVYQVQLNNAMEATSMKVYDLVGNTILEITEINSAKAVVDLGNSANGVYFLEINTANGKAVQKLIKESK